MRGWKACAGGVVLAALSYATADAQGAASGLAAPTLAAKPSRCEDLAKLKLPDTTIASATQVDAAKDVPAFCKVVASVTKAADSDVKVEVWLPEGGWKGVFHGVGNGGYAGTLQAGYAGMAAGLKRGYATATTDTGTAPANGLDGDALIGHPRRWKDWGLYSTHEMTVTGKALTRAYYGKAAKHAYYTGCSTGGQQGLIEALYYPKDYDGLLVGAPVVNRTWGHAVAVWDYRAANLEPGHLISDAKLGVLHNAVLKACGGLSNGLAGDTFLADPESCKFNPATVQCSGADAADCLTPAEVATAKAYYVGPSTKAGRPLYYGWPLGSEGPARGGWSFTEGGVNHEPAFDGLFKWVFGPKWDWKTFDLERDMPKVDALLGPSVNGATKGDLRKLKAAGGKMILYQGWADTLVAPDQTVAFYGKQTKALGGPAKAQNTVRLFMAPGVMHCGLGSAPNAFNAANGPFGQGPANTPDVDMFAALAHWVEEGKAPAKVIATRYIDDNPTKGVAMQRPLCPYPQKAWYNGKGDTKDAASFVCSVKKP